MCNVAIVLTCLASAVHARQVDNPYEGFASNPLIERELHQAALQSRAEAAHRRELAAATGAFRPVQAFSTLLMALDSVAASLNTRARLRLSAVNPTFAGSQPALQDLGGGRQASFRLRGGSSKDASNFASTVSAAINPQVEGDEDIIMVACLGAGRSAPPVASEAFGTPAGEVAAVPAPTPFAVMDVAGASDSERDTAIAAADVLVLEVHFEDLIGCTAHGLEQLSPMLHRLVRLRDLCPKPKLLLLTVSNYDASEASKAEVSDFASQQLVELIGGLSLPVDALQLQCIFVPREEASPEEYKDALTNLYEAVASESAAAQLSAPASDVVTCLYEAADRALPSALSKAPAEVHVSYQCSVFAEAAARQFQKGAIALRKAAASEVLVDFGERAHELMSEALAKFDADSVALESTASCSSARSTLAEQLQRALYGPFRKQLALLQQLTLANFLTKLVSIKASSDIEVRLNAQMKLAMADFDASVTGLLPSGMHWTSTYERAAVVDSMQEAAREHVEKLQVQGLYVSKAKHRMPVDFSAHWLLPHPFGHDSRYNPLVAGDGDSSGFGKGKQPIMVKKTYTIPIKKEQLQDPQGPYQEVDPKEMVFQPLPKKGA